MNTTNWREGDGETTNRKIVDGGNKTGTMYQQRALLLENLICRFGIS
jgi:hypothetical protein